MTASTVGAIRDEWILSATQDPELFLSKQDSTLARLIASTQVRWPRTRTEHPIWGLLRMVMAQQVSTSIACQIAARVLAIYPFLANPIDCSIPSVADLRSFGLPEARARCCSEILQQSSILLRRVEDGESWSQALKGIKGIGPWTIAVFQIMVMREPDVLPVGDVGLARAIANLYGQGMDAQDLGENWRPYRSVACWYLWRTLGNMQLG
jgi:DNA-3-methyladenine glycosylase II